MSADRARLSHDPGRTYRAVVLQQGRVTLEADGNEGSLIAETALRRDMIDVIGPFGTCDNGYEVTVSPGKTSIGPGSYHIGGWRMTLPKATLLGQFDDELDLDPHPVVTGIAALSLLVTEQEVSAVEDRPLREVALGGPDTAQRTRLMQRVVAVPLRKADNCTDAAGEVAKTLKDNGALYDPATGALLPTARLQVTLIAPPAPEDPCDPPASGGYLGADNQLLRVSVIEYNRQKGVGKLVWGYDNASTLYRAKTADGKLLTLEGEPVDSEHSPRLGQAVEILQTRTLFDHGEAVAADSGLVTTVAQPYDPDLRRVQIADPLPAGKLGDETHPIFVRLWESIVTFTSGSAVELGDTGLAVTVTMDTLGDGTIVARPYWAFAARPSTPVIVYPRRYLDLAQPPEGPRQWLAPLAVVAANTRKSFDVLDDCRDTFVPLTKIHPGCCGVMLEPDLRGHHDGIQRALDRLRGTRGTVMLKPGNYKLRKPLLLDASHKGLTLEGCGEGVFLEAADEDDPAFAKGLIVLDDVNELALRSLQFQMPAAKLGQIRSVLSLAAPARTSGIGSVGVTATGCAQLTISECQFRFRLKEQQPMFAVGLLARGECWGLRLTHNRFLHDIDYQQGKEKTRQLYGFVLVPSIALSSGRSGVRELAAARIDALLESGEISDNSFVGLTVAMLVMARLGYVRVERNHVRGCSGGIYLLEAALGATLRLAARTRATVSVPASTLAATMTFSSMLPGTAAGSVQFNAAAITKAARLAEARARKTTYENEIGDGVGTSDTALKKLLPVLERVADAVDSGLDPLAPRIHLNANDVEVFGALSHKPLTTAEMQRPALGPYQALLMLFEKRESFPSEVIVGSNRFASLRNIAAYVGWPRRLAFTGNFVRGSGNDEGGGALVMVSDPKEGMISVMGNVVDRYARIFPAEHPQPPSQAWDFLNMFWS